MKPITSNALAQVQQAYGHEPITVIKIEWTSGTVWYAGRDLTIGTMHVLGKLLSVASLSSTKKQDSVGMIATMAITLDDSDLALKQKIDNSNVEYTPVTVYQWFGALTLASDLMQIYKGSIINPVQWSEDSRTLTLDVETKIKDQEVGLSADINSIQYLNPDAVDVPWPLAFGDIVHSIALKLLTAPSGRLKYPFRGPRNVNAQQPSADPYLDDAHFTLQDGDGAYFPQGVPIQVQIDGVIFSGIFRGTTAAPVDVFSVAESNMAKYENINFITRGNNIPADPYLVPDPDLFLTYVAWIESDISIVNNYVLLAIGATKSQMYARIVRQEGNKVWFDQKISISDDVPKIGEKDYAGLKSDAFGLVPNTEDQEGTAAAFHFFGPNDSILQVAKNGRVGWGVTETTSTSDQVQKVEELSSVLWRFPPETEVTLWQPFHKDVYVANLIPNTDIVAVYANHRTPDGVQSLKAIPPAYYTAVLSDTSLTLNNATGAVTPNCCTITFETPLRDYIGQGWGDQLYVVMHSSVGPNVSDVIKWLLDTYASVPVDTASFTTLHTQVANYPVGFTRHAKENVASLAEQIAFQARIGLIVDNGSFQAKYLSAVPTHDLTVGESGVKLRSLSLKFTTTEDIYTRIEGRVKLSYFPAKRFEKLMVYGANVAKYGLRRREIDFFIYNIQSLAQKSLNFWGGRFSNSWRMATFTMPLDAIQVQLFDTIRIQFADTTLLNASYIDGVVDKVSYNPNNDEIMLDVWLPMVSGTTSISPFAWQDDSGDVLPADPTVKYEVTAFDVQHPNGESKRNVITQQDGGAVPARVVDLSEAGEVKNEETANNTDTANSNANSGVTPVQAKLDLYGNGYGNPPTKTGVMATAIDPANAPTVGQRVLAVERNNRIYFETGSGGGIFPCAILEYNPILVPGPPILPAGSYQIDIYANGFDHAVTLANQNAQQSDPYSFQFQPGEVAVCFLSGGKYYILTRRPFVMRFGKILSGTNPYEWQEYNYPMGTPIGDPKGPAEVDGGACELNNSTAVEPDKFVWVKNVCRDDATEMPDGSVIGPGVPRFWFDDGAGSC